MQEVKKGEEAPRHLGTARRIIRVAQTSERGIRELAAGLYEKRNRTRASVDLQCTVQPRLHGGGRSRRPPEGSMKTGDDTDAMCNDALMMRDRAEDDARNAAHAVELFAKPIEPSKNTDGVVELGKLLRGGEKGVERDTDRAARIFRMAMDENNHPKAVSSLAALREG